VPTVSVPVPVARAVIVTGGVLDVAVCAVVGFVPDLLLMPCSANFVGTTAFDGVDGPELPAVLMAVTVKV
jgi:hypothetical protein